MNSREKRIVGFACAAHALCHMYVLVLTPALVDVARQFGVSIGEVSAYLTGSFFCYGLGSIPAGALGDRWGPRRMFFLYFVGTFLSSLIIIASRGIAGLGAGLILLGLFAGIYHPAGLAMISLDIRERGHALGIHGIAGSIGVAAAPILGGVMNDLYGWRYAYVIIAFLGLIIGAVLLLSRTGIGGKWVQQEETAVPNEGRSWMLLGGALLMMIGAGVVDRGLSTILPTFVDDVGRLNLAAIGLKRAGGVITGLGLSFGIIGQYVGGRVADRVNNLRLYAGAIALAAVMIVGLTFSRGLWLLPNLALLYLCFLTGQPAENNIVAVLTPSELRGRSYGVKSGLMFAGGSFGALIVGTMRSRNANPYATMFPMLAGIIAGGILVGFGVIRLAAGRTGARYAFSGSEKE